MNEEMLIEIWLMASGYMEKSHIETAAEHFVSLLSEYTDDMEVFQSMKGVDPHLDGAITDFITASENGDFLQFNSDEDS